MKTKKKTLKKKTKIKVTKYQMKTFLFELHKTKKPEDVDGVVNEFLRTHIVKDEDQISIEQGEGYIRVSIIYKVKVDKV